MTGDLSDRPTSPGPDGHRTFQTLPKGVCLSCPVCPVTGLVRHCRTLSAVSCLSGLSGRRGGWRSFFHHPLEFASDGSAIALRRDQQSWSLLATDSITIDLTQLFAITSAFARTWECHGKIRPARYPGRIASQFRIEGGTPETRLALPIPCPRSLHDAAPGPHSDFPGALLIDASSRSFSPSHCGVWI